MGMNVLVVDDSKETRQEMIQSLGQDPSLESILEAGNGADALRMIANRHVDLILTDMIMPEIDGFKLIETLRKDDRYSTIPVVLLTIRSNLEDRLKGLEIGAWDFLVKPVHPVELSARVKSMLRLKGLQDKLKNRILQLERLAIIDELTGLYNKKYLIEYLQGEVNRSKRFGFMLSCIVMDVDHFKEVNDRHGHLTGDLVLRQLGEVLGNLIRTYDFAARHGGDEFALVLPQQSRVTGAEGLAERIRRSIESHRFEKEGSGRPTRLTVSMGVASFSPQTGDDYETVLERADKALYKAKASGRNRTVVG